MLKRKKEDPCEFDKLQKIYRKEIQNTNLDYKIKNELSDFLIGSFLDQKIPPKK